MHREEAGYLRIKLAKQYLTLSKSVMSMTVMPSLLSPWSKPIPKGSSWTALAWAESWLKEAPIIRQVVMKGNGQILSLSPHESSGGFWEGAALPR